MRYSYCTTVGKRANSNPPALTIILKLLKRWTVPRDGGYDSIRAYVYSNTRSTLQRQQIGAILASAYLNLYILRLQVRSKYILVGILYCAYLPYVPSRENGSRIGKKAGLVRRITHY